MTPALATDHPARSSYRVEELQRALQALDAGHFRTPLTSAAAVRRPGAWAPSEPVVPVLGCVGSAGTTTLAVAIATTAAGPARVVECAGGPTSGLVAASTAELGLGGSGWWRGTRDQVLLERVGDPVASVDEVPLPAPPDPPGAAPALTVLDMAWPLEQVLHTQCWPTAYLRVADVVVLVTTATVPGLRRVEVAVELLAAATSAAVVVAVRGPSRKRWDKAVEHTLGPTSRDLAADGRLVVIPQDRHLAVLGLGPAPLPPQVLAAAVDVLRLAAPAALPSERKGPLR